MLRQAQDERRFAFPVKGGEGQVIGPMILASSHVADGRVSADGTSLRLYQNIEHGLDVSGIAWQAGRRAGRTVMEIIHVVRQLPA